MNLNKGVAPRETSKILERELTMCKNSSGRVVTKYRQFCAEANGVFFDLVGSADLISKLINSKKREKIRKNKVIQNEAIVAPCHPMCDLQNQRSTDISTRRNLIWCLLESSRN